MRAANLCLSCFFYDRNSAKCAAVSGAYCKILRDIISALWMLQGY